jgi:hypothetical protein
MSDLGTPVLLVCVTVMSAVLPSSASIGPVGWARSGSW